jgi:hypothetical protein
MTVWKWATVVIASVLVLGAFAYHIDSPDSRNSAKLSVETGASAVPKPTQAPVDVEHTPANVDSHRPAPSNYKDAFRSTTNYWQLAESILPAAREGDSDAQYYLSRILERCDQDNKMYFQRRGQKLSLDEGLRFAVRRNLSIETAQSVFEKCHEFMTDEATDLGSASQWLERATNAGQPMAQATTAEKLLMENVLQNAAKAGGVPYTNPTGTIEVVADPQQLFKSAIRSKDPEVLFAIGDTQEMLHPSASENEANRFAWYLVACQHGLDCSGHADWVKNICNGNLQCASPNDASDVVRTFAGDKWPEVQQRAQEISSKIDANLWDELNL